MSGISQTIPSYTGGISEQPDYIKNPGQVSDAINVVPDVTYGLYKRPGLKHIGTMTPSSNDCKWFHYFRNFEEGSFIGQIDSAGAVKMWRTQAYTDGSTTYAAGALVPVTTNHCVDYLKNQSGTSDHLRNIQITTVKDTTFVTNRKVLPEMETDKTGETSHSNDWGTLHKFFAFLELKKTENGRQYALDIGGSGETERTYKTATKLEIQSTNRHGANKESTGHCPGIGTNVFNVSRSSGGQNLVCRLTVTGQQGPRYGDSDTLDKAHDFSCSYTDDLTLLHGGEDWVAHALDQTTDNASGEFTISLSEGPRSTGGDGDYEYNIHVTAVEEYKAKVIDGNDGFVRPRPTAFDADTAVSASAILGSLLTEIKKVSGLDAEIVGNGIYIFSDSTNFNVKVLEPDLMRVISDSCNDVSELPTQCKHKYRVKVDNSQSDQDDYYLKFIGMNDQDGSGSWVEIAKPRSIYKIKMETMPVTIKRTAANAFTVDYFKVGSDSAWANRSVGDDNTNPIPSFLKVSDGQAGSSISKVLFWRNRLCFISDQNVNLSAPNDLGNFWRETALTSGPNDGIEISANSLFPSALTNGIETNAGLVLFSQTQQFLLSTDDTVVSPDTSKITPLSTYYNNKLLEPISLGTSLAFIDNSGNNSRFMEMVQVQQQTEPSVFEHSKVVPTMLPKDLDIFDVSRDNGMVFIGKSGTDTVYLYRYYTVGEQRLLSSWFKWKFHKAYKYFCVTDDQFFLIDENNNFMKMNLIRGDDDFQVPLNGRKWDMHLDNWKTISGGTYNATNNVTTFSSQPTHSGVTAKEVIVNDDGHIEEITRSGSTLTVKDDWSDTTITGTKRLGFIYDMEVDLPKFYPTKNIGQRVVADVNASLVLHRIKVALGKVGSYESTLTRLGKDDYTDTYESAKLNQIILQTHSGDGDIPYLLEEVRTIPIYDRNSNVTVKLKSSHPSPATLKSISWEGDYTTKNYRRV